MAPVNSRQITPLRQDLLLVTFLIGLDVAARLLMHAWNASPLTASALFAGMVLHRRSLAFAVPLVAMAVSDVFIGPDNLRIQAVVYAALLLPAALGILARRLGPARAAVPAALTCSLIFFVTTNFAVWAFGSLYSFDMAGLIQCYVAALPFLKYTVAGDLFWTAALFGGAWLVQRLTTHTGALSTQR